MLIYLMRHGRAENHAGSDEARRLTEEGIADNLSVAHQLDRKETHPNYYLASPYVRARQTTECLQEGFPDWSFAESELITPDANLQRLLSELEGLEKMNPLLVAHNPLLSNLLTLLVDGASQASSHLYLDTSNLACVEMDVLAPGCGELKYILRP